MDSNPKRFIEGDESTHINYLPPYYLCEACISELSFRVPEANRLINAPNGTTCSETHCASKLS